MTALKIMMTTFLLNSAFAATIKDLLFIDAPISIRGQWYSTGENQRPLWPLFSQAGCTLGISNLQSGQDFITKVKVQVSTDRIYLDFNSENVDAVPIVPDSIKTTENSISFEVKDLSAEKSFFRRKDYGIMLTIRPVYAQGIPRNQELVSQYQISAEVNLRSRRATYTCRGTTMALQKKHIINRSGD